MMDAERIKQNLIKARGDKTMVAVSKETGISVSALSMYESGDRVPRDEIKERLAKYYGTTVGSLFFGE